MYISPFSTTPPPIFAGVNRVNGKIIIIKHFIITVHEMSVFGPLSNYYIFYTIYTTEYDSWPRIIFAVLVSFLFYYPLPGFGRSRNVQKRVYNIRLPISRRSRKYINNSKPTGGGSGPSSQRNNRPNESARLTNAKIPHRGGHYVQVYFNYYITVTCIKRR